MSNRCRFSVTSRLNSFVSLAVLVAIVLLSVLPASAQWPQWGGAKRDFTAECKGLASQWPAEGPKRLWSRELGDGYSAILADQGKLYTLCRKGETDEAVVALDEATGKTVWEHVYPAPLPADFDVGFGPGPHSTPLIVGDNIYAVGSLARLHCLDKNTGKVIWSHDLIGEYGAKHLGRGYSASPIAYKNTVILPIGAAGKAIMAFDQKDGKVVWEKGDISLSHSSPILINLHGQDQLVFFSAKEICGVNPDNGEQIWSHGSETEYGANISTPTWCGDDIVFCSAAYDPGGSRAIKLESDGGKIVPKELWYTRKLRIHHGNAIHVGDYIYGSSGDSGPSFFTCVDLKTGDAVWRERGFGKANCVYGDGKLILLDEDGQLILATPSPEKLTIHSKCPLLERSAWTVPTLAGTKLYVRDRKNIMALDLS